MTVFGDPPEVRAITSLTADDGLDYLANLRLALYRGVATRCQQCGDAYWAHSADSLYCSPACRKHAAYMRCTRYARAAVRARDTESWERRVSKIDRDEEAAAAAVRRLEGNA